MKKWWIGLGALLLAVIVAVSAVLLLRQPPLLEEEGIDAVVLSVTGRGHKELTDPAEYRPVLQLLNRTRRQECPEDTRKGWNMAVYVYYEDGARDTVWLVHHANTATPGVTEPTGEYMSRYPDGNYRIKDGTIQALWDLCDSIDKPFSVGILPEERMQQAGLVSE